MADVASEASGDWTLASLHELDDLRLPLPIDTLDEAEGTHAPVASRQLQMLVGIEADGLSILGLIQVLQVLQMQVEDEVWDVVVRFLLRFLCG